MQRLGICYKKAFGLPIKKAGDGIRTHDLLLGKETFYH